MKPTIGRIVFYKRSKGDVDPYPAIITFVDGDRVCMTVFFTNATEPGVFSYNMAPNFKEAKEGEWCWPERI